MTRFFNNESHGEFGFIFSSTYLIESVCKRKQAQRIYRIHEFDIFYSLQLVQIRFYE